VNRLWAIAGLAWVWCWCLAATAVATEVIPPVPQRYFNDYANITSPATANRLNRTLEDFERQTSTQLRVAVYPKMESDSSIEDYTERVFREWKIGMKGKNNGAVLFLFVQDHRMRIQTGYGLEGVMPDLICKRILDNEISPRFKQGDFDGGLTAGVNAMIAASKGEYKGTGHTLWETKNLGQGMFMAVFILVFGGIFVILFLVALFSRLRRPGGWNIGGSGLGGWGGFVGGLAGGWLSGGGGGGGWSSGGGDSGGGGGGDGGGFSSSGGGDSGGGGASGSW